MKKSVKFCSKNSQNSEKSAQFFKKMTQKKR